MHISKLSLVNYRNFANSKLLFNKGVNTIIGENGSGKTNLFRAIRLLLDDNMLRSASRLDERDFNRSIGDWRGHWIIISLEFEEVSADEAVQSLFLHGSGVVANNTVQRATYNLIFRPTQAIRLRLAELDDGDHAGLAAILSAVTISDYETVFTGRSEANFNDPALYKKIVGDFEQAIFSEEIDHPEIGARVSPLLSISREVSFTFIQALRDVVADFQNNRTNPLFTLLKSRSGEISAEVFKPIVDQVKGLNDSIEQLSDVQMVRTDISTTIKDAAGQTYAPSSLSIRSDLPDQADKLFQSLKLFVGETEEVHEGAIHELSLGGANLIYLTLKLLEFKYQKANQSVANFLLVEEPEAHIHTHIQKTLFDKLNFPDTQIIYSTHSTHISEVSNVRNINILAKQLGYCEAYQPSTGLDDAKVGNIQRYLDAVRCNLLFAKSVMLVEGDVEEILVPILVKKVLGLSLDELGISLINIRSTGFKNVAELFHDARIKKRCGIITDLDAAIIDTTPNAADPEALSKLKSKYLNAQNIGVSRKADLEAFSNGNPWVELFLAPHTFEVDFVTAGNAACVVSALGDVYTDADTIALAKTELESADKAQYGQRVLTMAKNVGKGWFSILLGKRVDHRVAMPEYIFKAIWFARGALTVELWYQVLSYRLTCIEKDGLSDAATIGAFRLSLDGFRKSDIDFIAIRALMLTTFPADGINRILRSV